MSKGRLIIVVIAFLLIGALVTGTTTQGGQTVIIFGVLAIIAGIIFGKG